MPISVRMSYSANPAPSSIGPCLMEVRRCQLTCSCRRIEDRTLDCIPAISSSDADIAERPYLIVGIYIDRWNINASVAPIFGDSNRAANVSVKENLS